MLQSGVTLSDAVILTGILIVFLWSNIMKMKLVAVLFGASLLLSFDSEVEARRSEDQVTICHVPPGNPANQHTITVGASAVDAHMAHGDYMGDCTSSSDSCDSCGYSESDYAATSSCVTSCGFLVK